MSNGRKLLREIAMALAIMLACWAFAVLALCLHS